MSKDRAQPQRAPGVDLARALRQTLTPAERRLWSRLRDRRLSGLKFRRQHPIGRFIVDFCCPESRTVVEVDGDVHAEQRDYDEKRTRWIEQNGYRVLRFTNREVRGQLEAVLETILRACEEPTSPPLQHQDPPPPARPVDGKM